MGAAAASSTPMGPRKKLSTVAAATTTPTPVEPRRQPSAAAAATTRLTPAGMRDRAQQQRQQPARHGLGPQRELRATASADINLAGITEEEKGTRAQQDKGAQQSKCSHSLSSQGKNLSQVTGWRGHAENPLTLSERGSKAQPRERDQNRPWMGEKESRLGGRGWKPEVRVGLRRATVEDKRKDSMDSQGGKNPRR